MICIHIFMTKLMIVYTGIICFCALTREISLLDLLCNPFQIYLWKADDEITSGILLIFLKLNITDM